MSPVIRECEKQNIDYFILHTGQHYSYNLDKIFFEELELPAPKYNLDVGSGTHAEETGKMLMGIEKILNEEKPDVVLVEGDTNTVLAGALAATKLHISPYSKPFQGFRGRGRSPRCGVVGQSPTLICF